MSNQMLFFQIIGSGIHRKYNKINLYLNIPSVHKSGEIVLYPMATPNRRLERRQDLIQWLQVSITRDYYQYGHDIY